MNQARFCVAAWRMFEALPCKIQGTGEDNIAVSVALAELDRQTQELRVEEAQAGLSAKPPVKIKADKFFRALRGVLSDGNASPRRKQAAMRALVEQIVVSEEAAEMNLIDPSQDWFALASNMARQAA